MARLITHGWESGYLYEQGAILNVQPQLVSGPALISSNARSGNYAASFQVNVYGNSNIGNGQWIVLGVAGNPSEVYLRIAARVSLSNGYGKYLIQFRDGATIQVSLDVLASGQLQARCGATVLGTAGGIGTAWTCIEMRVKIDPSAGVVQVWQDGKSIISFTGNTRSSSVSQITALLCGWMNTVSCNDATVVVIDDIALNDTTGPVNNGRIGQGGIYPLFPIADTVDKDFSRSSGADNYSLVNSIMADDDVTYVQDGVVGDRDLYKITSFGAGGQIDVVTVLAKMRSVNGSGAKAGLTILSSNGISVGSQYQFGNAYTYAAQAWELDPGCNSVWVASAINSLLIGVTVQ